jgi:hypothetical protein
MWPADRFEFSVDAADSAGAASLDNTEESVHTKLLVLSRGQTLNRLLLSLGLIALGVAIPQMGMPQAITGSLINALLLITVETMEIRTAILIGLITPLSALTHGVLPLSLMVMIPFIGIANAILSTTYGALRVRSKWLALVVAASLKFACLYGVTALLVAYPLRLAIDGVARTATLPASLVRMTQWPQLGTALAGGLIALGLFPGLKQLVERIKR